MQLDQHLGFGVLDVLRILKTDGLQKMQHLVVVGLDAVSYTHLTLPTSDLV